MEVTVAGERVRLRGSYDRVETDPDGRLHIVDLKTGKSAPTAAEVARHPQLGVYQRTAADSGAPVAGAELVQLRVRDRHGAPKVQAQAAVEDGWVDTLLADAVRVVRDERFDAVRGSHCRTCPVRAVCPADDEGAEVLP